MSAAVSTTLHPRVGKPLDKPLWAGVILRGALSSYPCRWGLPAEGGVGMDEQEVPAALDPMRQVEATLVFTDVVDSTPMMRAAEHETASRLSRLWSQVHPQVLTPLGAELAEPQTGDELLIRVPHPQRVVECARLLHLLAQQINVGYPPERAIRLRIGAHHARYLRSAHGKFGVDLNLASRIAKAARPGQTLISGRLRSLLNSELDGELLDQGEYRLKGLEDEPQRVFALTGAAAERLPEDVDRAIARRLSLKPTLLVMPFEPPATAAPLQGLGAGDVATERLVHLFSQSPWLHVINGLSASELRGRQLSMGEVYRCARADYVLRGQVRSEGTDHSDPRQPIRLELELWRQGAGDPIWQHSVQGRVYDLLSAEGDLLAPVVYGVASRVDRVEKHAALSLRAGAALPSLKAHTLYLDAVDALHRFDRQRFDHCRAVLVHLHEQSPTHPDPLAWLARWHTFNSVQGWSADRRYDAEQAMAYSERALDRDPHSSLALTMAGAAQAGIQLDPHKAQALYSQALQHNPNDSLAWVMSSVAQGFMSQAEPALANSELALGLAPLDPMGYYYHSLGASAALGARQWGRATALAERALTANSLHGSTYRVLAIAHALNGRISESRAVVARLLAIEPDASLDMFLRRVPTHFEDRDLYANALLTAGLPKSN